MQDPKAAYEAAEDGKEDQLDVARTVRNDDMLLSFLASMIEKLDGGGQDPSAVSITVTVPGSVISGVLVPRRWWVEEITSTLSSVNEEFGGAMGHAFDELKPDVDKTPNFIHLRDARFVSGGSATDGGVLWRGRISDVSGWSFANIGPVGRA